jgi:hypothetical protein
MVLSRLRHGASAVIGFALILALAGLQAPGARAAGPEAGVRRATKLEAGLWRPDGTVLAIAVHRKRIYVAGDFKSVIGPQGQQRQRFRVAAMNRKTGALVKVFQARVNGSVNALSVFDGKLVIGGYFTRVNGRPRHHLAALDLARGRLVRSWKAQTDGPVLSLLHMGTRVYVGGDFSQVGAVRRSALFALNRGGHTVRNWPSARQGINGRVMALAAAPGRRDVIVAGHFRELVKRHRVNLGAVNAVSGHVTKWRPAVACAKSCPVRDVVAAGTLVYAGVDGPGGQVRAYQWPSGRTVWDVTADGEIDAVATIGRRVLVGGHFAHITGQNRAMFAALDASSGALKRQTVPASGPLFPGVLTIRVMDGVALLGGAFDDIAGQSRLAAIPAR